MRKIFNYIVTQYDIFLLALFIYVIFKKDPVPVRIGRKMRNENDCGTFIHNNPMALDKKEKAGEEDLQFFFPFIFFIPSMHLATRFNAA